MKYHQLVSTPSEVSNWLEEQLEARGIDAVVYARYILSLLYRDSIDIIYPTQDLHITHRNIEDLKKFGGGRKRFQYSSAYVRADAERLKRLAAIECLISASDQSTGIESLIDELCEKLKHVNDNTTKDTSSPPVKIKTDIQQHSPQDLAKQYYAAFPPLDSKYVGNFNARISKQLTRKQKNHEGLFSKLEVNNMKRNCYKSGHNFYKYKKDPGSIAKSMERSEGMTDWDIYMLNNKSGQQNTEDIWPQKLGIMSSNPITSNNDEQIESESMYSESEESLNIYDDLPVDIRELLNSPEESENISSSKDSVWSDNINQMDYSEYDNNYNSAVDKYEYSSSILKSNFKTINSNIWSTGDLNVAIQNEKNLYFDFFSRAPTAFRNVALKEIDSSGGPWPNLKKWSNAEYGEENNFNDVLKSFVKINHRKAASAFAEFDPKMQSFKITGNYDVQFKFKREISKKVNIEEEKEDLLLSEKTHFQPINEKLDGQIAGKYVDGTTFIIPSNLDNVKYKRSTSGSLLLEKEYGCSEKYYEYKSYYNTSNFVLKFKISRNDKACQTDTENVFCGVASERCMSDAKNNTVSIDDSLRKNFNEANKCSCPIDDGNAMKLEYDVIDNSFNCPVHFARPDSVTAEIFGNYEMKCEKCSHNVNSWNLEWAAKTTNLSKVNGKKTEDIWNGEICMACLKLNEKKQPLSKEENQLRLDIIKDGEQLLSDISYLQKNYMEEMPVAEISYDIADLIEKNDRKRRHSMGDSLCGEFYSEDGNFSFASFFEENNMYNKLTSSIPTLRSVTL